MRQTRSLFALGLAVLALAGCSSDKEPPRLCPQVAIVRNLERIEDHGRDAPDPSTLVAVAALRDIDGTCDYKDKGVDIAFDLNIAAEKGARLGSDQISFPFFVSLVGPEDQVIAKESMTTKIDFPSGDTRTKKTESLHVFLPLKPKETAEGYRVLLGFQLSEDQLKAAREKENAEAPAPDAH